MLMNFSLDFRSTYYFQYYDIPTMDEDTSVKMTLDNRPFQSGRPDCRKFVLTCFIYPWPEPRMRIAHGPRERGLHQTSFLYCFDIWAQAKSAILTGVKDLKNVRRKNTFLDIPHQNTLSEA